MVNFLLRFFHFSMYRVSALHYFHIFHSNASRETNEVEIFCYLTYPMIRLHLHLLKVFERNLIFHPNRMRFSIMHFHNEKFYSHHSKYVHSSLRQIDKPNIGGAPTSIYIYLPTSMCTHLHLHLSTSFFFIISNFIPT